eukprot:413392-Prymnesium_polylepis.2
MPSVGSSSNHEHRSDIPYDCEAQGTHASTGPHTRQTSAIVTGELPSRPRTTRRAAKYARDDRCT